jgi:VanZ family protein
VFGMRDASPAEALVDRRVFAGRGGRAHVSGGVQPSAASATHNSGATLISKKHSRWIRVGGVMAVALIIFASVMLPAKWEQLRTGHWALEHFLAYFATAVIVCLGWRRPFVVAAGLAVIVAPLLEALQGLEPTHSANFLSVISGASGAFAAALVVSASGSIGRRRSGKSP